MPAGITYLESLVVRIYGDASQYMTTMQRVGKQADTLSKSITANSASMAAAQTKMTEALAKVSAGHAAELKATWTGVSAAVAKTAADQSVAAASAIMAQKTAALDLHKTTSSAAIAASASNIRNNALALSQMRDRLITAKEISRQATTASKAANEQLARTGFQEDIYRRQEALNAGQLQIAQDRQRLYLLQEHSRELKQQIKLTPTAALRRQRTLTRKEIKALRPDILDLEKEMAVEAAELKARKQYAPEIIARDRKALPETAAATAAKAQVTTLRTSISGLSNALSIQRNLLEGAKVAAAQTVAVLEAEVVTAKATLTTALATQKAATADIKAAEMALSKAELALTKAKLEVGKAQVAIDKATVEAAELNAAKMAAARSAASRSLSMMLLPVAAVAAFGVYQFAKFDDAVAKSTAQLGWHTEAQRNFLMQATIQHAARGGVAAPAEVPTAIGKAVAAGYSPAEALKVLDISQKMAVLSGKDLISTQSMLIAIQKNMGLQVYDTVENMKNFSHVADAMAHASQFSQLSIEDFGKALSEGKLGGWVRQYKMNVDEVMTTILMLGEANFKGARSGTAAANMFRELTSAFAKNHEIWKLLKLDLFEHGEGVADIKTAAGMMDQLTDAYARLSDQQKILVNTALGFSRISINTTQGLMGQKEAARFFKEQLVLANGSLDTMYNTRMQSFLMVVEKLWRKMQVLAIVIGATLAPTLEKLAKALDWVITRFMKLPEGVRSMALLAIGGIFVVGLTFKIMQLVGALSVLKGAWAVMGGLGMVAGGTAIAAPVAAVATATLGVAAIAQVAGFDLLSSMKEAFKGILGIIYNFSDNWKILCDFMGTSWTKTTMGMLADTGHWMSSMTVGFAIQTKHWAEDFPALFKKTNQTALGVTGMTTMFPGLKEKDLAILQAEKYSAYLKSAEAKNAMAAGQLLTPEEFYSYHGVKALKYEKPAPVSTQRAAELIAMKRAFEDPFKGMKPTGLPNFKTTLGAAGLTQEQMDAKLQQKKTLEELDKRMAEAGGMGGGGTQFREMPASRFMVDSQRQISATEGFQNKALALWQQIAKSTDEIANAPGTKGMKGSTGHTTTGKNPAHAGTVPQGHTNTMTLPGLGKGKGK